MTDDASTDLVLDVLVEAFGSSATPFVPVPWVDDWMLARLMRRVVRKVLERHRQTKSPDFVKAVIDGYTEAASPSRGRWVVNTAARFVLRKVSVVLDAKKSHDLFGEIIAFSLALDRVTARKRLDTVAPERLGEILHRSVKTSDTALLTAILRSISKRPVGAALGAQLDQLNASLAASLDHL
jgi:hypothetical protein